MHATADESSQPAVAPLRPSGRVPWSAGGVQKVTCGLGVALGAAFLVAVVAPAAEAAAPRVKRTSGAPLVAAQGDAIAVRATVVGNGKRAVIGLVLGSASGSAKKGLRLGAGKVVRHRRSKQIVVRGRVPATVTPGQLRTLLVCVNPAAAVRGKGRCRKAARIATSGRSAEERIAGARRAGRISVAQEVVFGLYSLRNDPRLPRELRGDPAGPGGDQDAIKDAANSFGTLPLAVQKQVFPFFVPPQAGGSAWQAMGRNKRPRAAPSRVAAATAAPDCSGYNSLDAGTGPAEERFPWQGVPTSDGKAIVWYGTTETEKFEKYEAEDRAAALLYAAALPEIWEKLSDEFGEPQSDAGEACYHGPDGRFDVYVGGSIVLIANAFDVGALAVTAPYPAVGNYPVPGKWCTDRPAWIAIQPGLPKWALAHEFMHAIQFSHRYVSCDPPIAWWDEGGANWAADFVYPDDDYEQREYPGLVKAPLGKELQQAGYEAWPFWMMLEETEGIDALRGIFAAMETKRPAQAVDAAVSGGLDEQVPQFFLHAYNQSPIGDPGFEIDESFEAWDGWSATPALPAPVTVNIGGLPSRTLNLKIQRPSFPPLSAGAYHRVNLPDDAVREVQFKNELFGKPGGHVDALLHLADGSWKHQDWTAKKTVTLCRDIPEQDVQELVVVSTNAGLQSIAPVTHTLKVRSDCPHVYKIVKATLNETFTGQKAGIPPCPPFSGLQTNTMTLTNQPLLNRLFGGPQGLVGTLIANGVKDASTTMQGCDLLSGTGCTAFGSGTITASVMIQVTIPKDSPTAAVQWFLTSPTAGLGSEGAGTTCFITPIGWTLDDQSIGLKSVPRAVFEADAPQTISIDVDFDLTDPTGAQIHASESYSLTIQRVSEDGSPL